MQPSIPMFRVIMPRLLAGVVTLALMGCVAINDPSLNDPKDADVAYVAGSFASGREGVDIFVTSVDEQMRYPGKTPTHERRVFPGRRRITVYVPGVFVAGLSEFSFNAAPRHHYEVSSRKGGGFFLIDLYDVTNRTRPVLVMSGKFGAVPFDVPVPTSPFVVLYPE